MESRDRLTFVLVAQVFLLQNLLLFLHVLKQRRLRTATWRHRNEGRPISYSLIRKMPEQSAHLRYITQSNNVTCVNNLRMNCNAFSRLSYLLEHIGGLKSEKFVSVPEKVAMFLSILAHHKKNRVIQIDFKRSGYTISKCFNDTLKALLKISQLLLITPNPIDENESNDTWRHFQGCLGALDGTLIDVRVPIREQCRYISRKGDVSVNVLGVRNKDLNFIYILAGWEGSAADSWVLRAAISKPNGLRVPTGNYYLCDCGYSNADDFLTPYRGTRYHLTEWRGSARQPQNPMELFNLRHSKARTVIERAFCLLTRRWAVLRSTTFYPIKIQNWIILACALLHNFIRTEMDIDPLEEELGDEEITYDNENEDVIETIETSNEWTQFRETLANNMYAEWRGK